MSIFGSKLTKIIVVSGALVAALAVAGAVAASAPHDGGDKGRGQVGETHRSGTDQAAFGLQFGRGHDNEQERGGKDHRKLASLRGPISLLDAANKKVTIARFNNSNDTATLTITDATKIRKDGKDATWADLKVGDMVTAVYDRSSGEARILSVHAQKPERAKLAAVSGTVAALDSAGKKVTIAKADNQTEQVTITITSNTKLKRDGKDATFDQIKVGDWAMAVYDRDSGAAKELNAFTERPVRPPLQRYAAVRGAISAIDVAGKKVTLGQSQHSLTLDIADDTKLIRDGKSVTLDQFQVGDRALVVYDRDNNKVLLLVSVTMPSGQKQAQLTATATTQV